MNSAIFHDHVGLVTGGGSGIGRATAIALAKQGAAVVVAGRRREQLDQTTQIISRLGGRRAHAYVVDVTSAEAVAELVAKATSICIAEGVRINTVSPGPADTAMSLRPGETEEDRSRRLRGPIPPGAWRHSTKSPRRSHGYCRRNPPTSSARTSLSTGVRPHDGMPSASFPLNH